MTYDATAIDEFLDAVASERVTPAGGTAAAITGATGAALCEMVCVHTIAASDPSPTSEDDDSTGPDVEAAGSGADRESLSELGEGLQRSRRKLLTLGEQDAALVDELFGGEAAPSTRRQRRAAGIPLAIAEEGVSVLADAETVHHRGRSGVAADAKTGAYLADAAVRASLETVRTNAAALPDRSFAAELDDRAAAVERSAATVRRRLFGSGE